MSKRELGASSIACPIIFNHNRKFLTCLCISGPSFCFTNDVKMKIAPIFKEECTFLSHHLDNKASAIH